MRERLAVERSAVLPSQPFPAPQHKLMMVFDEVLQLIALHPGFSSHKQIASITQNRSDCLLLTVPAGDSLEKI